MRAIVLDYKGGKAALLLEDGTTAYRRMRCQPGEYVEIPDRDNIARMTSVMRTVAAMLVLVLGLGAYYSNVVMEYSYVSVDVNPSIEFSLNRRDRIVKVEALNKDAGVIVSDLNREDISGKTLYEAMELTVKALIKEGFMDRNEAYMLLDVASQNEERGEELSGILEKFLSAKDRKENVKYAVVRSTMKDRAIAKEMKLSSGRYEKMLENYGASDVSAKAVAEYQVKPVREMVDPLPAETVISAEKDKKTKDEKPAATDKSAAVKAKDTKTDKTRGPENATASAAGSEDRSDGGNDSSGSGSSDGSSSGSGSSQSGGGGSSGGDNGGSTKKEETVEKEEEEEDDDDEMEADDYDDSEDSFSVEDESFDDESDPSADAEAAVGDNSGSSEESSEGEEGPGSSDPSSGYEPIEQDELP